MLSKAEPRVAKITGYQVKFVEKPGRNLCNMFQKEISQTKYYREDCKVCFNSNPTIPSICQLKGVVYLGICRLCDHKHKNNDQKRHKGIYVGETSRTLSQRAKEHFSALKRLDDSSFMLKHSEPPWVWIQSSEKNHYALSKLLHEAVRILKMATLNSKSEWGGVQNSPTVSDKNWKRDKWCDPLQLTPNVELQINALYFETPSPYAILPTPESVLGLENSMTQNIPLSIGTTTSWSPTITPTQLVNSVKRSIKTKSLTKKQSTLSSRSCHSRTPFDRMQ